MIDMNSLIARADAYKVAAGVSEDTTVSHRVFGDTKKLSALRRGGDITVRRFNAAMAWFDQNWPAQAHPQPFNPEITHDTPETDAATDAA
ncbi:MAG: hypothetical protein VYB46_08640 [Pseudomonadota bacterium]|nr:hypothetical protein [Pseudomonadota bacterium]